MFSILCFLGNAFKIMVFISFTILERYHVQISVFYRKGKIYNITKYIFWHTVCYNFSKCQQFSIKITTSSHKKNQYCFVKLQTILSQPTLLQKYQKVSILKTMKLVLVGNFWSCSNTSEQLQIEEAVLDSKWLLL